MYASKALVAVSWIAVVRIVLAVEVPLASRQYALFRYWYAV